MLTRCRQLASLLTNVRVLMPIEVGDLDDSQIVGYVPNDESGFRERSQTGFDINSVVWE